MLSTWCLGAHWTGSSAKSHVIISIVRSWVWAIFNSISKYFSSSRQLKVNCIYSKVQYVQSHRPSSSAVAGTWQGISAVQWCHSQVPYQLLSCLKENDILQWLAWGKYSVLVPKLISALRNCVLGTLRKVYILHRLYRNCILILLLQIPDTTVHCNLKTV